MASTYSANLKIELIGTGEQSGTWGSTTNTNLGTALEEAIVGRATATFATDADLTLTLTNTNATQIARAFALRLESSVNLTATRNLIVPAINKPYIINNQTTGGQSIVVKNATGSGVTIPNGKRVAVYNNGTDVLTTIDYFPTLSVGGTTIPTGKTLVDTDSSQTLTNKTLTSPSISGATLTDGTANGVLYLNGSKVATSGSALTFDGASVVVANSGTVLGAASLTLGSHLSIANAGKQYLWSSGNSFAWSMNAPGDAVAWYNNAGLEQMRLTSTGLGIGTSSPAAKLEALQTSTTTPAFRLRYNSTSYYLDALMNANGDAVLSTPAINGVTSGQLKLQTNGGYALMDSNGNLGLGVTPSAWVGMNAMQVGPLGAISSSTVAGTVVSNNAYATSNGWAGKYITTAAASIYEQYAGQHIWLNAPSGTAGNPISFTQAMTLDASGNLGVGTSSPATKLHLMGTGDQSLRISTLTSGSPSLQLYAEGSNGVVIRYDRGTSTLQFENGGTTSVYLGLSGNLGLGVTPSAWGGGYKAFQTPAGGIGAYSTASVAYAQNAYDSGIGAWKYLTTGVAAGFYNQSGGQHQWFTAPSGTAGAAISFTQAMTLDASGKLAVGTTAVNSSAGYFQTYAIGSTGYSDIGQYGYGVAESYQIVLGPGTQSNNSGQQKMWRMRVDKPADAQTGSVLSFGAYNGFDSTVVGNYVPTTNWLDRLVLNASGNLGIDTSSPNAKLEVVGNARISNASTAATNTALTIGSYSLSSGNAYGATLRTYHNFGASGASSLAFEVSGTTEAMRIDASGNLLVGTTTASSVASGGVIVGPGAISSVNIGHGSSATSGTIYESFQYNGSTIGSITQNGTTAVAYNTSSDYRLKNITGPVTNSGAYIDSLNPVEGTWKADGSTFVGLIAHEVQEVSRTQVATGEKDGEQMQAMDYSNSELIANLIAEVQALRKRVAQLEAR